MLLFLVVFGFNNDMENKPSSRESNPYQILNKFEKATKDYTLYVPISFQMAEAISQIYNNYQINSNILPAILKNKIDQTFTDVLFQYFSIESLK